VLSGQQEEISLDLEIAGGIAPNASLIYVYAGNALAAVQYAIDQNYAPVISYSYALCEAQITAQGVTGAVLERLAQMGNAMGITWVASSGDQGAAACDNAPGTSGASNGLAVNIPASIPEVTAVGGTTFNDVGGGYWSATNSVSGASAKSYIPEATWNDFTITHLLTASGGGASALYAKPAWQTGPGVPNDGARDVPDVSFAASPNHDGYLMVQEGVSTIVGGTSASTPVFAGMLTLLNQYLVAAGLQKTAGLGNVNPTLYRIARSSGNVMHDVTSGDNVVACALNTPNCTGGEIGWAAGTGYDLATGLGSVDLTNLAKQWVTGPGAALTLAAVPGVMNDNTSQPNCPFEELLVVQENNGYPVELTRLTTSAGKDYSASILNLFGSLRLPANGALLAPVCWTGITPSYTEIVELDGVDSLNNTVSAKATINFETPSVSAGILSASPGLLTINAAAGQSATGTVSLSVPAGQQWSLSVAPAGLNTAWMKVAPQSGTGPAQITVSASGAGLANGAYIANLIFQSANTSPQFVTVGVAFVLGAAPANTMKIAAVANTASGQQVGAPGMYLSVYGTGLAPAGTSMASSSSPIPISLAGVSATVNGLPAAVEYVSPNQVNLLLPFEIPAGNTELAINNNGQVAAYTFSTQTAAPGIFVDGNGMVAGAESAARGAEIAFYVTGQGDVNPLIASNTAAAPPAAAPVPLQAVSVTIGGVPATVAYSALAYNFEGLMQVNVFVPSSIATGVQPIVVSVGGTPSLAAKINITN
jgi:uncharacterized protein (TIGR03437 family)